MASYGDGYVFVPGALVSCVGDSVSGHIGAFDPAHPQPGALAAQKRLLESKYGADVAIIANRQVIDLSSTQVREALAAGRGRDLVTDPVYGYIQRRRLYGVHTDLHHLTPDQLRPIALSYLKPKRMPHVLGTEQEAVRLARQYGADETQARIAALLHDCTKKLDMDRQLALCRQYGIPLDDLEQHALKLLHAKTGAAIARDVFGVDDAVYRAIYWHTTGHANMTKLEKIIYLADYIEPSRDFPGWSRPAPGGPCRPGPGPAEGAGRQHPGYAAVGQPRASQHPGRPRLFIER